MTLPIRFAVISTLTLLAVGCGGGATLDKDSAARIAGLSAQQSQAASEKGGLLRLMESGNGSSAVSASCTNGGTVSMHLSSVDLGQGLSVAWNADYDACTEPVWDDPETRDVERDDVTMDGTVTVELNVTLTQLEIAMRGRLDLTGAVKDFVDMNVTQSLKFDATSSSVSFTQTIDGSITTSGGTHTYDNETYRLTATGEFVKDGEA